MTHYEHLEQIVNFTTQDTTQDIWSGISAYCGRHPDTEYRSELLTNLITQAAYWYYSYIDLHVTMDDIRYHLFGDDDYDTLATLFRTAYAEEKIVSNLN